MQKDLFSGQQPVSKQSWLDLVYKDLKGVVFDEKLTADAEGLRINPLYLAEDVPECVTSNDTELEAEADEFTEEFSADETTQIISWNICEEIVLAENTYLNDVILPVLKRGCNYIRLLSGNWDKFFDEIRKIQFPATFALHVDGDITEENIVHSWRERIGYIGDRDRLIHSIEFDPVSYWMQHGNIENANKTYNNLADMFFRLTAHLQDCRILKVDVSKFDNKSATEQLAFALAITSEYFDKLNKRNVPLEDLIHLITFRFAIGNNYFLEIAKLQAFNILWKNIVKAFLPRYDYIPNPYIHVMINTVEAQKKEENLISHTTLSMSAILGGCDVLSINGSEVYATHIQNILRYESYFDKYKNAAEGSFYLESITTQLAEKAWKRFQEMERENNFFKIIINA